MSQMMARLEILLLLLLSCNNNDFLYGGTDFSFHGKRKIGSPMPLPKKKTDILGFIKKSQQLTPIQLFKLITSSLLLLTSCAPKMSQKFIYGG